MIALAAQGDHSLEGGVWTLMGRPMKAGAQQPYMGYREEERVRQQNPQDLQLSCLFSGNLADPQKPGFTAPGVHYGNSTHLCLLIHLCSLARGTGP